MTTATLVELTIDGCLFRNNTIQSGTTSTPTLIDIDPETTFTVQNSCFIGNTVMPPSGNFLASIITTFNVSGTYTDLYGEGNTVPENSISCSEIAEATIGDNFTDILSVDCVEFDADTCALLPADAPTDPPVDAAPTDPPVDAPTDPPVDTPTDPPVDAPTDPPVDAPTDPPTDGSAAVTSTHAMLASAIGFMAVAVLTAAL